MCVSRWNVSVLAAAGFLAAGLVAARAAQPQGSQPAEGSVIRDGFEAGPTSWQREYTDTTVRLLAHERSPRAAHGGRLSERFQFEAGPGSRFYVSKALPKVPVTADLSVSLYVRSNRAGAQLFGWVVLPADIDPDTKAPSFLLVPGTAFSRPDRWQKLELVDMLPAIEEQARVLRASTRRPVPLEGAYVERVVVNLMAGQGETEVFLDDLEVGPVSKELAAAWAEGGSTAVAGGAQVKAGTTGRTEKVEGRSELPPIRLRTERVRQAHLRTAVCGLVPHRHRSPGGGRGRTAAGRLRCPGHRRESRPGEAPPRRQGGDVPPAAVDRRDRRRRGRAGAPAAHQLSLPAVRRVVVDRRTPGTRSRAGRAQGRRLTRSATSSRPCDEGDERHLATATVDGEYRLYARSPSNLDVIGIDLPVWGTSQTSSRTDSATSSSAGT